jgi:hypothetical protein
LPVWLMSSLGVRVGASGLLPSNSSLEAGGHQRYFTQADMQDTRSFGAEMHPLAAHRLQQLSDPNLSNDR